MKMKSRLKELIFRFLGSKRMTKFADLGLQNKRRLNSEKKRIQDNRPHVVNFFHNVADPYSYLTIQKLNQFKENYNVTLNCILVGDPPSLATPEPEIYKTYSLLDVKRIASFYNASPPTIKSIPNTKQIKKIERILTNTNQDHFINKSLELGHQLWQGHPIDLELQDQNSVASEEKTVLAIKNGNTLRHQMKHYLGAIFHYEGENYWGLDRLKYLENRLIKLGLNKTDGPLISKKMQKHIN